MTSKPYEVDGIQTRDEDDQVCETVFNEIAKIVPRKRGYGWVVSLAVWFHLNSGRSRFRTEYLSYIPRKESGMIFRILDSLVDLRQRYHGVVSDLWAVEVLRAAFLIRATHLPGSLKERDFEMIYNRRPLPDFWCLYCGPLKAPRLHHRDCPMYHSGRRPGLNQASPFAPQMKLTDFLR